jgi:Smg protein
LDERIMNLVSLITDQVQTKQDLFSNEGKIMDSLMSSGYHLHEADAALTLMQTLSQNEEDGLPGDAPVALADGMRSMNTEERSRFTIEAFGFITKLSDLGIISEEQREELLDKALSLHSGRIELSHMKSLLALDLFADEQGYEDILASALNHKGTVWN